MAATSAGRVLTLCKQFQNVFRISSTISNQHSAHSLTRCQSYLHSLASTRQTTAHVVPSWHCHVGTVGQCRPVHTTISKRGLDEFLDSPENWGVATVKSGAPWTAKLLRAKSNEDLHKLWYVLLKEKNMLLTIQQEAKRQTRPMPSPERLKKLDRSMVRLETVVRERENALRLLQTGQERGRPGAWRKTIFGHTHWHRFKEHVIPWHMNRSYKKRKFYTPGFVAPHVRLRVEQHLRARARRNNMERRRQARLKEKFPHLKVSP